MSTKKSRKYRATRAFRDAGTGQRFAQDQTITMPEAEAQNYLHAGLIEPLSAPDAESPKTRKGGPSAGAPAQPPKE